MSEEDNTQVSEDTTVENAGESQTQEPINDSMDSNNVSSETSQESNESGSDADNVSTDEKATPKSQDVKPEKVDSKPISRRSAAYRIQQLVEENKSLKQQQKPAEQDDWETPAEDEPQPDIAALIAKEVEKRLHPIVSENSKTADDGEISELFSGEKAADRSSYEPKIREMWNEAQYKDVAASDLYKIAKFDELSNSLDSVRQQAVEDYKKAEREAKDSSAGGTSNSTNRTGNAAKSVSEMTDEELMRHNERIKAGVGAK